MKLSKILFQITSGAVLAASLSASALDFTITGSTAFRSITFDRAKSLFDAPGPSGWGDYTNVGPGTFSGTMSNQTTLGSTVVNVRLSFSGSGAGMTAVDAGTPVVTIDPGTSATDNLTPDLAFSDVYPESANPSLNGADFDQSVVGVIPFEWVCNNSLAGVTNITREQALLLMDDSGILNGVPGMPASYLGYPGTNGNATNVVWLTGRDSGSGTRITTQKDIGYSGTSPILWAWNGSGFVLTNGMTSGGLERGTIANGTNCIGYLGLADAGAVASSAFPITYEGVRAAVTNVQSGAYPFWGYEHVVNKAGALSAQKKAVRDALITAITNQGYQTTNSLYTGAFVDLARMQVNRGTDGGPIKSNNF